MDTTMFEFTSIEDMLFDAFNTSKEYLEFCSDLDELGQLSAYDEGMTYDDTKTSLKNDIFKIGRNTWDTTKDVGKIYKYATDSKAKTYKGLWDLFVRLLQLITKVIAFIWNMLGRIPVYLLRLIDWITHLPSRIVNKIKGNIELYITVDDIKNIYSVDLFENIGIILKDAKVLMNSEFWTKWKTKIHVDGTKKISKHIEIPVLTKDPGAKKAIQEIVKIYESKLSKIRFVKSIVDLGREDNVNLYFKTKEITVTNRYMKSHTGSYLDLLNGLITDMKDKQTELQDVSKLVSDNLQAASTEDGFLSLSASDRAAIYRSTQCLSGTINILGNIVKYAQKDIQTIDNARKRIMKKDGKKNVANDENPGTATNTEEVQDNGPGIRDFFPNSENPDNVVNKDGAKDYIIKKYINNGNKYMDDNLYNQFKEDLEYVKKNNLPLFVNDSDFKAKDKNEWDKDYLVSLSQTLSDRTFSYDRVAIIGEIKHLLYQNTKSK